MNSDDSDRNDKTDQTHDWPAGPRPESAETHDWPAGPRHFPAETRDWPTGQPSQRRPDPDVDHTRLSPTTPPGVYQDETVDAARYFRDQQPTTPPRWDPRTQQPGWSAGQAPLAPAPSEPTRSAPPPEHHGYPPPKHPPFSHDAPTWTAPPGLLSGQLASPPPRCRGRLAGLVSERRRWWLLGAAAAAIAVVVAAVVILTGSDDGAPTGATASSAPSRRHRARAVPMLPLPLHQPTPLPRHPSPLTRRPSTGFCCPPTASASS